MDVIRNLGEGYYGVEASGVAIKLEAFNQCKEVFMHAISVPDDAITIHKPAELQRTVGSSQTRNSG